MSSERKNGSAPGDNSPVQSSGYRPAGPYSVEPPLTKSKVPYPQTAKKPDLNKQKQKEQKKKRTRLFWVSFIVIFLLLLGIGCGLFILFRRSLPANVQEGSGTADSGEEATRGLDPSTETDDGNEPMDEEVFKYPYATAKTVMLWNEIRSRYMIFMDAKTLEVVAWKYGQYGTGETATTEPGTEEPGTEPESGSQGSGIGQPDFGKSINAKIYPASLTKLMTLLVAYEHCGSMDDPFRMTYDIINPLYLAGLSLAGFSGGETVPIRDLFYGTALPSGAEAAVGLAVYAAGSEQAFVNLMNEKAKELGMKNTRFVNCTGQHNSDHYTSLGDLAILMATVESVPELAEILSTYKYTTTPTAGFHPQGFEVVSTTFAQMYGNESGICEIVGGKTGYTEQAMQCLATYGVRMDDGHAYVCITACGQNRYDPIKDCIYLFGNYSGGPLAGSEETSAETEEGTS
ncbi:MAG: D-alanyl-D-alanine carboxypeptidase [Clostridia bacterium]|nr:D-alanyl-D-alanine carboxypeptidase [Clostridia bacterium]